MHWFLYDNGPRHERVKDSDCNHAKRVCKDFEIKHLIENHELCLKNDALLSTDIFEKLLKNMLGNI